MESSSYSSLEPLSPPLISNKPSVSSNPSKIPSISLQPSSSSNASSIPTSSYMLSMNCPSSSTSIAISTDGHPSDTTWHICDNDNKIMFGGGPFTLRHNDQNVENHISEGLYKFETWDSYEDGMCGDRGCRICVNNKIMNQGGCDNGFSVSEEFMFAIIAPSSNLSISNKP